VHSTVEGINLMMSHVKRLQIRNPIEC